MASETPDGSGIEGMRSVSPFARYVAERLRDELFKLIDVGCAGGVAPGWRQFGDRLAAVAFDANADEIVRLAAAEPNPNIRYVCGFLTLPVDHPLRVHLGRRYTDQAYWHAWVDKRLSYDRTQDVRAAKAAGRAPSSIDDYFHKDVLTRDWNPFPLSGYDLDYQRAFQTIEATPEQIAAALADSAPDKPIYLPAYLAAIGFEDADFLKIDVDGPDFDVLRSANSLLERPGLLGVAVEVCFYGSHDANDNSFHNMDRLMRQKGFDLFGLSVRKYASAALPIRYWDVHPSMTVEGRPVQGDAIYIRDLSSRARRPEAAAVSDEKLAKLAALFSLFTLQDQAAEVLIVHRERLSRLFDIEHGLDLLAAEIQPYEPVILNFRDYETAFAEDDERFYDEYGKKNAWHQRILDLANTAPRERDRALADRERLQAERDRLEMERDAARRAADEARRDLEAQQQAVREAQAEALARRHERDEAWGRAASIEGSTVWRATAPLRKLLGALRRSG
jgi:hypothetical protein